VFRGGFTLEAAQAVTGTSLKTLMALVNKSLLRRDVATGRYDIHELLRQFGEEQLESSAENSEAVHAQHCAYFVTFLQQEWDGLTNHRQMAALDEIGADLDNVLVAWNYALARGRADLLRVMAFSIWFFCETRMAYPIALELFRRASDALHGLAPDLDTQVALGMMLVLQGNHDFENPIASIQRGLNILRQYDCPAEMVCGLINLGLKDWVVGDYIHAQEGERASREGLAISEKNRFTWGTAMCLVLLSTNVAGQGRLEEARQIGAEAVRACQSIGHEWYLAGFALAGLGPIAVGLHDYAEAERILEEGVRRFEEVARSQGQYYNQGLNASHACLDLARVAVLQKDFPKRDFRIKQALEWLQRASVPAWDQLVMLADLLAEAGRQETAVVILALVKAQGPSTIMNEQGRSTALLANLQIALPAATFGAAFERGKTLDYVQLVANLLSEITTDCL
jgi:tetratricopeptide (TPR) repeat protein